MQLTKNFKLSEFGNESSFTQYQLALVKILANELQNVRDVLNSPNLRNFRVNKDKEIGMKITSGLRTQADYIKLVNKGYNPSKTSDHYFGSVPSDKPTIGAADVVLTNFNNDYEGIYKILVYSDPSYFKFGQIILEYNPSTKNYWIHFGNDPRLVFSESIANVIPRSKYLTSKDNGKTYKPYTESL